MRTTEKEEGEKRAWGAFVQDVVNSIGDVDSTCLVQTPTKVQVSFYSMRPQQLADSEPAPKSPPYKLAGDDTLKVKSS